jgi:hypothetical protein
MVSTNSDQASNLLASSKLRILDAQGDRDSLVKTANLVLALEAELARVFGSKPNEGTSELQHERAAYVFALKAMADFFKSLGIPAYDRRFYRLAVALDDLNRGRLNPLVCPSALGAAMGTGAFGDE